MSWIRITIVPICMCGLVLAVGGMTNAQVVDSSAFNWKYEFEGTTADTPDNLDIDGNGKPDMILFGTAGPGTVAGGVMTLSSNDVQDPDYGTAYIDDFGWKPELTDGVWKSRDFSDGFTIEAKVKVIADTGIYGATSIAAAGSDLATETDTWLNIGANRLWWMTGSPSAIGPGGDNTDDFHVFRMAVDSSTGNASVWRDGILQAKNLPDLYAGAGYKRLYIGDISSRTNGTVEYDYIRFTEGYFGLPDPEPLPQLNSSAFNWKYEFEGATADTPDNLDIDSNGKPDMMHFGDADPGTVADGVMTLSSTAAEDPNYGTSYIDDFGWKPELTDGVWKSRDLSNGFTIEAKIKVIDDLGTNGATSIAGAGSDLSGEIDTWLNIGANGQWWAMGAPFTIGPAVDNTDGFHVFRMTVDASTGNVSVWRDGELLAENLPDLYSGAGYKRLYIGDISSKTDGTVEYDYIRFTEGAYAPASSNPLPGDANNDGVVNEADAAILAENWLTMTGADWGMGDFNDDGAVDDLDATLLAVNWSGAAEAVVPEPSSLAMMLVMSLVSFAYTMRRQYNKVLS